MRSPTTPGPSSTAAFTTSAMTASSPSRAAASSLTRGAGPDEVPRLRQWTPASSLGSGSHQRRPRPCHNPRRRSNWCRAECHNHQITRVGLLPRVLGLDLGRSLTEVRPLDLRAERPVEPRGEDFYHQLLSDKTIETRIECVS